MKIILEPHECEFIRKNYKQMPRKDMAKALGLKSVSPVNTYMRNEGLKVSEKQSRQFAIQKMTGKTTFTAKEDAFIKENYLKMPVKTLGQKIGRSYTGVMGRLKVLGLEIPEDVIKMRKKQSQFNKGHRPANKGKKQSEYMTPEAIERTKKTRFKKGDLPVTAYEQEKGVITIRRGHPERSEPPYKYIKLAHGKWQLYHQYLWEQKNGKIPKDHCLWFKDGNSLNCTLENLECITRAENLNRNWHDRWPNELKRAIKLTKKINNYEQREQ